MINVTDRFLSGFALASHWQVSLGAGFTSHRWRISESTCFNNYFHRSVLCHNTELNELQYITMSVTSWARTRSASIIWKLNAFPPLIGRDVIRGLARNPRCLFLLSSVFPLTEGSSGSERVCDESLRSKQGQEERKWDLLSLSFWQGRSVWSDKYDSILLAQDNCQQNQDYIRLQSYL